MCDILTDIYGLRFFVNRPSRTILIFEEINHYNKQRNSVQKKEMIDDRLTLINSQATPSSRSTFLFTESANAVFLLVGIWVSMTFGV